MPAMDLELDPTAPVPLYLQLADRLARLLALGVFRPGERIPTVREIAARARVNRNTAARAVDELVRRGWVRARVGQGTFVVERDRPPDDRAARQLDARLDQLILEAERLRLPLHQLHERLARRIEVFRRERERLAAARERREGAGGTP